MTSGTRCTEPSGSASTRCWVRRQDELRHQEGRPGRLALPTAHHRRGRQGDGAAAAEDRGSWEAARRWGQGHRHITTDSWRDGGGKLHRPSRWRACIPSLKLDDVTWMISEVTYSKGRDRHLVRPVLGPLEALPCSRCCRSTPCRLSWLPCSTAAADQLWHELITRLRLLVMRGRVQIVDDAGAAQLVQVKIQTGWVQDKVPRLAEYGLHSNPPAGPTQCCSFWAATRRRVVIATGHQQYRLHLLPGEVALADDQGQVVKLSRSGIEITAPLGVAITKTSPSRATRRSPARCAPTASASTATTNARQRAGGAPANPGRWYERHRAFMGQDPRRRATGRQRASACGDDLITALTVSLFTDRRAADDDELLDGSDDRRGWWGDNAAAPLGSRLWMLERSKRTQQTLQLAGLHRRGAAVADRRRRCLGLRHHGGVVAGQPAVGPGHRAPQRRHQGGETASPGPGTGSTEMPYASHSGRSAHPGRAADRRGASGSDPLLRTAVLKILGDVQAGAAHLQYGYLDWIAQQSNPFTASDEFLEAWAALKSVTRLAATSATGTVTFSGTNGTVMPSGTVVVRGDGWRYITTAPPRSPAASSPRMPGRRWRGRQRRQRHAGEPVQFHRRHQQPGVMTSAFTGGAGRVGTTTRCARACCWRTRTQRAAAQDRLHPLGARVAGVTRPGACRVPTAPARWPCT